MFVWFFQKEIEGRELLKIHLEKKAAAEAAAGILIWLLGKDSSGSEGPSAILDNC